MYDGHHDAKERIATENPPNSCRRAKFLLSFSSFRKQVFFLIVCFYLFYVRTVFFFPVVQIFGSIFRAVCLFSFFLVLVFFFPPLILLFVRVFLFVLV